MNGATKLILAAGALSLAMTANAAAFSISFSWGNLKKCTTGNPNRVDNPKFSLSGVPAGTAKIRFKMKDINVPNYNHGGGTVAYSGGGSIAPGAFKYKSPCPPNGAHMYEWTATALGALFELRLRY